MYLLHLATWWKINWGNLFFFGTALPSPWAGGNSVKWGVWPLELGSDRHASASEGKAIPPFLVALVMDSLVPTCLVHWPLSWTKSTPEKNQVVCRPWTGPQSMAKFCLGAGLCPSLVATSVFLWQGTSRIKWARAPLDFYVLCFLHHTLLGWHTISVESIWVEGFCTKPYINSVLCELTMAD